jgi:hypothetical protein
VSSDQFNVQLPQFDKTVIRIVASKRGTGTFREGRVSRFRRHGRRSKSSAQPNRAKQFQYVLHGVTSSNVTVTP